MAVIEKEFKAHYQRVYFLFSPADLAQMTPEERLELEIDIMLEAEDLLVKYIIELKYCD